VSGVLDLWSTALADGVASMREGIFALFDGVVEQVPGASVEGLPGAWVSYVGERLAVEFALVAPDVTLVALTAALTGLAEPSELAVSDAVIEIANMLGGVAKRRLVAADPTLRTGMPKFLYAGAVVPRQTDSLVLEAGTVAGPVLLGAMVSRAADRELAELHP